MAALTGNQIDQSYLGLIKTTDNLALTATAKAITDGGGGATNIEMTNTATNFVSGTVDFTGSTVSGITGIAGLISGAASESMISAPSLTSSAATAAGQYGIAIGFGAIASASFGVGVGVNAEASASNGAAYGRDAKAFGSESVSIGENAIAQGANSINIGVRGLCPGTASNSIFIGTSTYSTTVTAQDSIAMGNTSSALGIGSVAIGKDSSASANNSVALGEGVTASTADTTTVNLLQIADYANIDYADDTAAAAGGIPLGGVYHTSGAVKIRIA